VLKKKYFNSSNVLSRFSKYLSFFSFQRHHKRHSGTIFYTPALHVLLVVHQQANILTTRLGITQDNLNRLKHFINHKQTLCYPKAPNVCIYVYGIQIDYLCLSSRVLKKQSVKERTTEKENGREKVVRHDAKCHLVKV
jgi:hypothetical protein